MPEMRVKRGRFEVVPHPLPPDSQNTAHDASPKCAKAGNSVQECPEAPGASVRLRRQGGGALRNSAERLRGFWWQRRCWKWRCWRFLDQPSGGLRRACVGLAGPA